MKTIQKTVIITDVQEKWLEDNTINLTKFVRKCLEERMAK